MRTNLPARDWVRRLGATLLIVCGVAVVVLVGLDYVATVYKGAQRNCLLGGTQLSSEQIGRVLAPGQPLEALVPRGSYTFLPMGLACDYDLADGSGSLRVVSGNWGRTGAIGGIAGGALAGAVILLVSRPRNQ
jgi:hypothetical protein